MKILAKMYISKLIAFSFFLSHWDKRSQVLVLVTWGLHVVVTSGRKKGKNPLIIFAESILSFLFSATPASNYKLKASCFHIYFLFIKYHSTTVRKSNVT